MPRSPPSSSSLRARFEPALGPAATKREEAAREEIGSGSTVPVADEDRSWRFPHLIKATLRTNHWVKGADGKRKPYLSSSPRRKCPASRASRLRDGCIRRAGAIHLRGGRSPARRRCPTAPGLAPGAGPHEGADGEERGDVPVGSKGGRVKNPPPASSAGVPQGGVECYRSFRAGFSTSPTTSSAQGRPAAGRAPRSDDCTWWSPRTRGHGHFLRIANSVSAEYSFWLATRSPRAAASATTTRRWGSRRKARGERQAPFPQLGVDTQTRRSPWSASAICRATCSATACCLAAIGLLAASTTATSSSTLPRPGGELPGARASSTCRSSWDDYDKSLISNGGGVYPRSARRSPSHAGGEAGAGGRRRQTHPFQSSPGRSSNRHARTAFSPTAASAPT